MIRLYTLLALLAFAFEGCSDKTAENISGKYFSVSTFIKDQEQVLANSKSGLKKISSYDSKTDSSQVSNPDWVKELSLFAAADINKPAWSNSFTIDTLQMDSLTIVKYSSNSNKVSIKLMEIGYSRMDPINIHILKVADNFVYTNYQELWYNAGKGYKITGKQKVLWFFETDYAVNALFTN